MSYAVFLKIEQTTHARFEQIRNQLMTGTSESQSKQLGIVLSDIACQIIEQVFTELLMQQKQSNTQIQSIADDSEKVIQQVLAALKKYLPWSVSFFSNERLVPMVNYLASLVRHQNQDLFIRYFIDPLLVQDTLSYVDKVREGQISYVPKAFHALTKIVDQGVTCLIREPKHLLKFNLVVDKTLNGVIHMTTHLGYKRLEKLGTQIDLDMANDYIEHFLAFLRKEA